MKIRFIYCICCLIFLLLITSCKTKKVVTDNGNKPVTAISASEIAKKYYETHKNFTTLYLRTDIDYQDAKRAQRVTAEIKIQKDKIILVSIRFLGFTVAKAMITPEKVMYYEKLGAKYFEGDYSTISDWLGTDLDFQKIQNMILGQPFDNLVNGKYNVDIQDSSFIFKERQLQFIEKIFTISTINFALMQQEISQVQKNRKVVVQYSNHEQYQQGILPKNTEIVATQGTQNTTVKIEITNVKYNEQLTFPYSVPSSYTKIEISK